jgi:cardiolipin synthase (CMP-forming)
VRLINAGARSGREPRELDTFWTVPNLITIFRFLGVPLFVWLIVTRDYLAAVVVLAVVGSTDWVDGYVARRFNQVSKVGKWLDPMADRLMLIVVAVTFVVSGIAPLWLVLAIVIPDAILLVNSLILFHGSPELPVSVVGKVRTAILMIGAPLLLLSRVEGFDGGGVALAANIILAIGCVGHLVAFCDYMVASYRKHRLEQGDAGDR